MCHAAPAGKAHRLGKTQITLKKASSKDNSVRHIRETGRIQDHSFKAHINMGPPKGAHVYVCLTFWSMVCTCAVCSFGLTIEIGMSFSNEQRTTPRVRQPSSTVHGGRPADRLSEEPLIFLDFGILGIRDPKIECSSQHLGFRWI